MSRTSQVSRQTVDRWSATGRQALEEALGKPALPLKPHTPMSTLVLSLLIETHASSRGIQASLKSQHGIDLSVGSIAGIMKDAGRRAQQWLEQHHPTIPRRLAVDEHESSQRGNASLHVSDVHSGHVWASVPPVDVDGERWTLVVWSVQEQGISRMGTVRDGGRAIQQAWSQVEGEARHQRDVWHLFHLAAQVQGRVDRAVNTEHDRVEVIQRHAADQAQGTPRRGRRPTATRSEQHTLLTQVRSATEGGRSLCQEVHTVLEVVVLSGNLLLSRTQRQGAREALLDLVDELASLALPALASQIQTLATHLRLALPHTLLCARRLDAMHEHATQALGPQAVALVAWAWLRRTLLGPPSTHLLQGVHPAWHTVASELLVAWDHAVRARSAVEHWQSSVRPHVAVHRTLSAGCLSLRAVWHTHRMAPRGRHEGFSPFQRTGSPSSHPTWLAALGSSALAA